MLDGVCITGGEPLLQNDIADFMREIKKLGYLVKLDTNGAFPQKLSPLIENSLVDYIAMDIKNCPEKYPLTCGVPFNSEDFFLPFKESIALLLKGRVDYEFRTTVTSELHSVNDIKKAGEIIKGARRWFLQCFKDSGDLIGEGFSAPDISTLKCMRNAALEFVQNCEIRGI